MKGITLPINTVVVLVLAIIVLIAVSYLFFSNVPTTGTQLTKENILRDCCRKWVNFNCDDESREICFIPRDLGDAYNCVSDPCFKKVNEVAQEIGITDIKKYCGC